jgi:hypothetical protein
VNGYQILAHAREVKMRFRIILSCHILLTALSLVGCSTSTTYIVYAYRERMVETPMREKWDCKEGVKSLTYNISHPNWYIRKEAIELLAEIHTKDCSAFSAIPDISSAMHDKDDNVRLAAAWALGVICQNGRFEGIQNVIAALSSGLKDKFWLVRLFAADSLGRIGKEANSAIKALVEAGSDENWWVRMFALLARKRIEAEASR